MTSRGSGVVGGDGKASKQPTPTPRDDAWHGRDAWCDPPTPPVGPDSRKAREGRFESFRWSGREAGTA
jgi:hypothetical protein